MLTISRSDIDCESITEFPISKRFIKLPVQSYLKLLPAINPVTHQKSTAWEEINRPQIALINAVNNPNYRFIVAALARRLGKTYIANIIGQLVALVPGCNILIMSPNYSLSSISFELQRHLIKSFDLEVTKDNTKDKVIELSNGSTVRMGSLSTVDSSLGRSYDLIIIDEAAIGKDGKDAFNVSLRPTLDKPNSKCIFISTPRGRKNWFSEFYQRGFSDTFPQWASLTADYSENVRMKESDVQEARNSMSVAEFEQEYIASFTTFEGQIYSSFKDEYIQEFEHSEGCEYIAGLDPGYKDQTGCVVIAYDPKVDIFHVVDEYLVGSVVTATHAEALKLLFEKHGGVETVFIDAAAAQFAADLAYTYDMSTIKAKKDVLPGIMHVQTLIETGRLRVSPECTNTLRMLDQYQWDPNTALRTEKPLHSVESHIADALRYALYTYIA